MIASQMGVPAGKMSQGDLNNAHKSQYYSRPKSGAGGDDAGSMIPPLLNIKGKFIYNTFN